MTVAQQEEEARSPYIKVAVFATRAEMEAYIASELEGDSGISYSVTVYPADATDVKIPEDEVWVGAESYTVIACEVAN